MKIKIASLTILLLCSLGLRAQQDAKEPAVENVDAKKFSEMLQKKDGVLIDLRTPGEIEKGYIAGSKMIDYTESSFKQEFAKLDKNKTTYVYCAGGGRSADAAQYLKDQGFKKVVNLSKGFNDWKKAGLPVEIKK
jgi:rhodanese-related sulfurtransferase